MTYFYIYIFSAIIVLLFNLTITKENLIKAGLESKVKEIDNMKKWHCVIAIFPVINTIMASYITYLTISSAIKIILSEPKELK